MTGCMKKEKERRKSTIDKREYMYHTNEQTNKRMEKNIRYFVLSVLETNQISSLEYRWR